MSFNLKTKLTVAGAAAVLALALNGVAEARTKSMSADATFAKCSANMHGANIQTCCTAWLRNSRHKFGSEASSMCEPDTQNHSSKYTPPPPPHQTNQGLTGTVAVPRKQ